MAIFMSFASFMETELPKLARLASPIFTGNPQAPTQPRFDDSTKLATTAFVKQNQQMFAKAALLSTNTALTADAANSHFVVNADITVTMPKADTVPTGSTITFSVVGGSGLSKLTLQVFAGDATDVVAPANILYKDEVITLISGGSIWRRVLATNFAVTKATGDESDAPATTRFVKNNYQGKLGFNPVQQGGGIGQGNGKVYIGWGSSVPKLHLQVDATNFVHNWPIDIAGSSSHLGGVPAGSYARRDVFNQFTHWQQFLSSSGNGTCMLELHIAGKHSVGVFVEPTANQLVISSTNGNGGNVGTWATIAGHQTWFSGVVASASNVQAAGDVRAGNGSGIMSTDANLHGPCWSNASNNNLRTYIDLGREYGHIGAHNFVSGGGGNPGYQNGGTYTLGQYGLQGSWRCQGGYVQGGGWGFLFVRYA